MRNIYQEDTAREEPDVLLELRFFVGILPVNRSLNLTSLLQ